MSLADELLADLEEKDADELEEHPHIKEEPTSDEDEKLKDNIDEEMEIDVSVSYFK